MCVCVCVCVYVCVYLNALDELTVHFLQVIDILSFIDTF